MTCSRRERAADQSLLSAQTISESMTLVSREVEFAH
jgi:hypothetical protein